METIKMFLKIQWHETKYYILSFCLFVIITITLRKYMCMPIDHICLLWLIVIITVAIGVLTYIIVTEVYQLLQSDWQDAKELAQLKEKEVKKTK